MEKLRAVLGKSYSYSGGEHLVSHKPSLAFSLVEEDGVGVMIRERNFYCVCAASDVKNGYSYLMHEHRHGTGQ